MDRDCHTHFYGTRQASIDSFARIDPALAGARAAKDLERTLMAGVTSVRELGGYAHSIREAVKEGTVLGPTIYGAVAPISCTGK